MTKRQDPVIRQCEYCGRVWASQRATARFCSGRHRAAWHKREIQRKAVSAYLSMIGRRGAEATKRRRSRELGTDGD